MAMLPLKRLWRHRWISIASILLAALCITSLLTSLLCFLAIRFPRGFSKDNPIVLLTWEANEQWANKMNNVVYTYPFNADAQDTPNVTFPLGSYIDLKGYRKSDWKSLWAFEPVGKAWTPDNTVIVRSSTTTAMAAGDLVTADYFNGLGEIPVEGRAINQNDEDRESPVVVMAASLVRRLFGTTKPPLGNPVSIEGHIFTLVGVTRPGFAGPTVGSPSYFWVPFSCRKYLTAWGTSASVTDQPNVWSVIIMGRPTDSRNIEALRIKTEMIVRRSIGDRLSAIDHGRARGQSARTPAHGTSGSNDPFQVSLSNPEIALNVAASYLAGMANVILLIGCIAAFAGLLSFSLIVSQIWAGRSQELAVQLLFAAPKIVYKSIYLEVLILAGAGAAISCVAAHFALLQTRLTFVSLLTPAGLKVPIIQVGSLGIAIAFASTLLITCVACAGPLISLRRNNTAQELRMRGTIGLSKNAEISLLVCAFVQVSIASSAVMIASIGRATIRSALNRDLGFKPASLSLVHVLPLDDKTIPVIASKQYLRLQEKIASTPGVLSVSSSVIPPVAMEGAMLSIRKAGDKEPRVVKADLVGPHFITAMGMKLVQGRDVLRGDKVGSANVAVINESFAKKILNSDYPIGAVLDVVGSSQPVQIVGVIKNAAYENIYEYGNMVAPVLYLPYAQFGSRGYQGVFFEIRTRGNSAKIIARIEQMINHRHAFVVSSVDREKDVMMGSLGPQVALSIIANMSAFVMIALAFSGLVTTMWFVVGRQRREIGIRLALGQSRRGAAFSIMKGAIYVICAGTLVGIPALFIFFRIGQHLYDEIDLPNAITIIYGLVGVALVGLCSGLAPVIDGLSTDISTTIKCE